MMNEQLEVADERIQKLQHMQTSMLIEVVKNYKQYGYTDQIRESALLILQKRGINEQSLKLSGNLHDFKYEDARDEYRKFVTNSYIALALFILSFLSFSSIALVSMFIYVIALLFMGFSFNNTKKLSKLLNDKTIDYSVVFIFLSVFLYFILFFVISSQIKEKMKTLS